MPARFLKLLLLIACLPLGTACATTPERSVVSTFEVPYLTTRAYKLKDSGQVRYSTDVTETTAGSCTVTLEETDEVLEKVSHYGVRSIDDVVAGFADRAHEGLLVYIHGYNIGLERACRQAARLAWRTGFEGRLLLFSWPASRTVLTYRKDERRMIASMPAIVSALGVLAGRFGADNINVVAHSMGSRAIVSSIEATPEKTEPLANLILIAPDIDRDVFAEALPELQKRVRDITVVVAESDRLLMLSQTVNLGERLGQASDFEAEGVEVIDVTGFEDLGFGNHVYHLSSEQLGDMLRVILEPGAAATDASE